MSIYIHNYGSINDDKLVLQVIRQAELRASNVASPPTPMGGSDEEMVEFIVKHGREKNIFWLPASRITQDRKWQVTFVVAKTTGMPPGPRSPPITLTSGVV